MGLKRVDGLGNLLAALDAAKHQYWSKHGVNNGIFQEAPNIPKHSLNSIILQHSASTNCSHPRASEHTIPPYIHPSNSSALQHSAQPAAKAKMVQFSEMDSSSLVAAALAPSKEPTNSGEHQDNSYSQKLVRNTSIGAQKSQTPNRSRKRRRRGSSLSSQVLDFEGTPSISKKSQRKEKPVSLSQSSPIGLGIRSDHPRARQSTHKNGCFGNSTVCDNEDGFQALPAMRKCRPRIGKTSKHQISSRELSDLGIISKCHERKSKSAYSYTNDLNNHGNGDDNDKAASHPQTLRQRASTHSVKKPKLLINSDPFTPSPPRRSPLLSPNPSEDDEDDETDTTPPTPNNKNKNKKSQPQKLTPIIKSTSSSTSKKKKNSIASRSTSAKNRTYAFPIASTLSEATEADKMLFRMKMQGRPWKEITEEWSRLTGRKPGGSSLSVRYIKLKEKFARMGDRDFARLIHFKTTLEQTFETTEKWDRVAEMIASDGGGTYSGQALKRKYKNLVEGGLQTLHVDVGACGVGGSRGIDGEEGDMGEGVGLGVTGEELDEVDRELMGDGGDESGDGDGNGEENLVVVVVDVETPCKNRGRFVDCDGPTSRVEVTGEYDANDDAMDAELVGAD